MTKGRWRRALLVNVAGPVVAVAMALAVSSIALVVSGHSPLDTFSTMWSFGTRADSLVITVNNAVPLYVSGIAFAIAFKLGLFNIGVEGQQRIAILIAAAAGAAVTMPAPLHVLFIVLVGMAVGAAWAGIAGVLKATRGVHEVISTIMLNFIATGLSAYLLSTYLREDAEGLVPATPGITPSGQMPDLTGMVTGLGVDLRRGVDLHGVLIIAIVLAFAYYWLVWRTRFGYDLRAAGTNPWAAQASGISSNRMIVTTMLLSGAVAGLVNMGPLLSVSHRYSIDFPTGVGFSGIAVALLGRNHPVGIAVGAVLFGFLSRSSQRLDLEGIPKEVVTIMTGVILLTVVVVYEVVHRWARAQETQAAAAAAGAQTQGAPA